MVKVIGAEEPLCSDAVVSYDGTASSESRGFFMGRIDQLQPNTTQIPNYLIDRVMGKISPVAFQILMLIARQTYGWIGDIETGHRKQRDWISRSQFREKTGKQNEAIQKSLRELEVLKLIQVTDGKGKQLPISDRKGKQLYYSIQTFPKIGQVTPSMTEKRSGSFTHNVTENRNSKIGHTKETNTKVSIYKYIDSGVAKKQTTCPLLKGSNLKDKYINGHTECVEYISSVEERRGFKFINTPKQYRALHLILKAGFGFDEMNKVYPKIEKRYGRGNWDFSTMSAWLEKGGANA